jgi:hypothetical protein
MPLPPRFWITILAITVCLLSARPAIAQDQSKLNATLDKIVNIKVEILRCEFRKKKDDEQLDDELRKKWENEYIQREGEYAKTLKKQLKFKYDDESQVATALNRLGAIDVAILALAGILCLLSCFLARNERRLSRRRQARSHLPGGMPEAILMGIALISFGGCNDHRSDPLEIKDSNPSDLKVLEEELREKQKKSNGLYVFDHVEGAERLKNETKILKSQIQAIESRRQADESQQKNLLIFRFVTAAILGALVVAPYWWAIRQSSREASTIARQCPRCGEYGQLRVMRTREGQFPGYKERTYLECSNCVFRVSEAHGKAIRHESVARLCIPTVGIVDSGKTMLLTQCYHLVLEGKTQINEKVCLRSEPSLGSETDDKFRMYIKGLYDKYARPDPTSPEFPDPLLIYASDMDSRGTNRLLLHMFDFAGEVLGNSPKAKSLRKRASRMDGFIMTLDPSIPFEEQFKQLKLFYEEVAAARQVPFGTPIPVPVAVCITKMDLLLKRDELKEDVRQLDEVFRPGPDQPVTLALLSARSRLLEGMLPELFTGVSIRRKIEQYFGTQMLFFPTCAMNLDIEEMEWAEDAPRIPDPYGVVEPILWLMHMSGYCVFDER